MQGDISNLNDELTKLKDRLVLLLLRTSHKTLFGRIKVRVK